MFNGVVINVLKKKLWHVGLRKLRFMFECARNRRTCGTVTVRRQTIFGHNAMVAIKSFTSGGPSAVTG
jgi:hypothetical protein